MNDGRFDAVSLALDESRSRRGAVATVLGGVGSLLGLAGVEAGTKRKNTKQKQQVCRNWEQNCLQNGHVTACSNCDHWSLEASFMEACIAASTDCCYLFKKCKEKAGQNCLAHADDACLVALA